MMRPNARKIYGIWEERHNVGRTVLKKEDVTGSHELRWTRPPDFAVGL